MINTQELLNGTLENLKVENADTIHAQRDEITKALNKYFRESKSTSENRLMVGSYGRHTAINGISDLDMVYILPSAMAEKYKGEKGAYSALKDTKDAIKAHYPRTDIHVDRLVVVVQFSNFKFEVQPVFETKDGSFEYPDSHDDVWKITKPRLEIQAMTELNEITHNNARKLCRLTRAWKNKHDVSMGGLLVDTLVWKFLLENESYHSSTVLIGDMVRDFFEYLGELEKQDFYLALGSGQRVKVKKNFQWKAKRAKKLCDDALDAEGKAKLTSKWKAVFGRPVPSGESSKTTDYLDSYMDTEQFIEDFYEVDISHSLELDCTVTQDGFRPFKLRELLRKKRWLGPQKKLEFYINVSTSIPTPYEIWWKVLNRGEEAKRRDHIRGQIIRGSSNGKHIERTCFYGEHIVECYVVRNNTVIARGSIEVPIENQ